MNKNFRTRARGIVAARAEAGDVGKLVAELNGAFDAFKSEQQAAMADLRKGQEDVVRTEKVERINADVSALTKAVDDAKAAIDTLKIGGGSGDAPNADVKAHRDAFNIFARKGIEPANMRELEVKAALTTDSDPDGGYLVPAPVADGITRVQGTMSAMRGISRVVVVGASGFSTLVNLGGAGSGWVGEREARPETNTPQLAEISPAMGELYANPAVTQRMLDDGSFDVEAWLGAEIATEFAEKEGGAFISGDGSKKPRGFLDYDKVANASYAWGKTGFVVSGKADGFLVPTTSVSPADAVTDLFYALKSSYRDGAVFLTSDPTAGIIRKFKDGNGTWLWQPPTAEGPATILGKPVVTDDNMPAVVADAFPLAFGNFQRGYLIADRFQVRVIRDPLTNKPFVHFYATKRVGGGIVNFEAIKLLKIST